ncbi:MAG: alpha/beta hydrolase [Myxococcales bacterium]|nr:alpha/beta hydrolase [Myxococcales bacterium]
MKTKTRVQVRGASIAFTDTGGPHPPVVLIHGNSASTAAWARQLEGFLAKRFRLVALDLPGCGESDRLPCYTFDGLSALIATFAENLGCEDAIFVGHSLGGHLLLETVPRLSRARGFVVCGTPPVGKPPDMAAAFLPTPVLRSAFTAELSAEEILTWAREMVSSPDAPVDQIVADIERADPRLRGDMGEALHRLAYSDELEIVRALTQPIAILHGAADALVSGSYFDRLSIPMLWRGRAQLVEGAGHYPQLERPETFDGLLDDFVSSCC